MPIRKPLPIHNMKPLPRMLNFKRIKKPDASASSAMEERAFFGKRSNLFGTRGVVPQEVVVRRLHELRSETASQAEKFYPVLKTTFRETVRYLPKAIIEKAIKKKGLSSFAELELDFFRQSVFLPAPIFNEIKEMLGMGKAGQAFFVEGLSVIKVGNKRPGSFIMFPLLHEWIHSFDRVSGIERSVQSEEALAYGINIYVASKETGVGVGKSKLALDSTRTRDYENGFFLGKLIASRAKEIANIRGEEAAERFFQKMFSIKEIDGVAIQKARDEALR